MSANWKAKSFHAGNAEFLGKAADLAYENKATISKTAKAWNTKLIKWFRHKDTQAYIIGNDETLILAFRGTEITKIKDITTDLDARLTKGLGGKIHEGFSRALNQIWDDVWATLKAERGSRALWVTGHSLGGALATLAVARLRQQKRQNVNGLYTYGQPRVGNKNFAKKFDDDFKRYTFRFVNDNDAVPHVPPEDMNFSHIGTRKKFDKKGKLDSKKKKKSLIKKVGKVIKDTVTADQLRDHSMSNYLKNLKKLAKS